MPAMLTRGAAGRALSADSKKLFSPVEWPSAAAEGVPEGRDITLRAASVGSRLHPAVATILPGSRRRAGAADAGREKRQCPACPPSSCAVRTAHNMHRIYFDYAE